MVKAYNFLAAWQLFPEKCSYEFGEIRKSGNCNIESVKNGTELSIGINWVTHVNDGFYTSYNFVPDSAVHSFENTEVAEQIRADIPDSSTLIVELLSNDEIKYTATHEIMPNGYLKITQKGFTPDHKPYTNVELYHKQMRVLPYASSVSGAVIRPTKEGVVRHQALTAMEEQTNMQLDQIKQQIELLARQAQEIVKRKELSIMIYDAKLNFRPVIGQKYHLYQQKDDTYLLSMVSPQEWGNGGPFKRFVASVKLLADHTWIEVGESKR